MQLKKDKVIKVIVVVALIVSVIFYIKSMNIENKPVSKQIIDMVLRDEEINISKDKLNKYESLLQLELKKENKKKNLKEIYYSLGYIRYSKKQYDESINYLKQALDYKLEDKDDSNILDIMICSALSTNYIQKNNLLESEKYFKQSQQIAIRNKIEYSLCEIYYARAKAIYLAGYPIDDVISLVEMSLVYSKIDEHIIRNNLFLSSLYRLKGEYKVSFEYTDKSLELSMDIKNNRLINKCIIDLGENYYIQHNYTKTINIYEKLIKSERLKDIKELAPIYGYLLYSYAKEGDYEEFNKYRELYLEISKDLDEKSQNISLAWLYVVCSQIETDFSNLDKAREYLNKAKGMYAINESNVYPNMNLDIEFSEIKLKYIKDRNYNIALKNYENLLSKIKRIGIKSEIQDSIVYEILKLSIRNKDYETMVKYVKGNSNILEQEILQVKTDNVLEELDKMIKENEISKLKLVSIILVILVMIMIYDRVSLNKKNKEIQSLNSKLEKLNKIDYLTETYNKGYLNKRLKELCRLKQRVIFIMIDIDYFKLYNDNYGHVKGDDTLIIVAKLIKNVFKEDMVFRYGGEEFSVISNKDIEEIKTKLNELQEEVYKKDIKHEFSKASDRITLSIGVACSKIEEEQDILNLVKIADEKLYKSKEQGRNRYTF